MKKKFFIFFLIFLGLSPTANALEVEILSSENLQDHEDFLFIRASLSGNITRLDGSTSDYKVPFWYMTPKECTQDGVGVLAALEALHFAGSAVFLSGLSGTDEDRLNLVSLADSADVLLDGRWLWGTLIPDPFVLDAYRNTELQGIFIDDSYFINGWEDMFHILKEASLFFRQLCHVEKTIIAGSSYSGFVARSFYFNHLNTQLATGPSGKVFDGSIQMSVDNLCIDTNLGIFTCDGPPPETQGKVMTIQDENVVILSFHVPGSGFFDGVATRGSSSQSRHYEVPGTPHFITKDIPFILGEVSLRESQVPNIAEMRWFNNAAVDHMRRWLLDDIPPPANADIEGVIPRQPHLPFGFLPSAFLPPNFDLALDGDLNADGGVRLPHIEVPLGLYRGMGCNNSNFITDPFSCPSFHRDDFHFNAGTFTPYPALAKKFTAHRLSNPCDSYASRQDYLNKVQAAAMEALQKGWVRSEDIPAIIEQAELHADQYAPGCVPQ